ncbi:magnesium and cobalt transport protein CorA [Glycomyces arizonensis]|uniref:magnesium and cobalt transport protein CorA n=1 Tax=Glycomyces arizonensis TaxID=256035 RepID=UPI000421F896|nr:magnesium and cobalt transport protein CorA [Glycomyces arizonensis]
MVGYSVTAPGGVERREGDPAAIARAAERLGEGEHLWAELDEASGTEVDRVLDALGMARFGAEGRGRGHPKVERAGDTVMLVVKTLWYIQDTRQIETGDLVVYADGRSLVTVRRGQTDPIPAVRDRIAGDAALRADGVPAIVYALLDRVTEDYATALESLSDEIESLERAVFSGARRDFIERIYSLIRETLEFQNAVEPLVPFARTVRQRRAASPVFSPSYLRDVAGRLLRVEGAVDSCMSLLTTVLTAHQGQIGTWQNEDMRKISAWGAIALVPTAIAGIYGMNFEHMPELHWVFGYPLVIAVMAVTCLLLYRGFKRNGWL